MFNMLYSLTVLILFLAVCLGQLISALTVQRTITDGSTASGGFLLWRS